MISCWTGRDRRAGGVRSAVGRAGLTAEGVAVAPSAGAAAQADETSTQIRNVKECNECVEQCQTKAIAGAEEVLVVTRRPDGTLRDR